MIEINTSNEPRVSQGDLIRNIEYIEYLAEVDGSMEISKVNFPLVVVLTQDCDLKQYHDSVTANPPKKTQDKNLFSVLVAPIYNSEHFLAGEHLSELGLTMQNFNIWSGSIIDQLKNNQMPRFHYLDFPKGGDLVNSVIDFKHYFSVHVPYAEDIKKVNFAWKIEELYREDISHRFSSYLSRIGLPD